MVSEPFTNHVLRHGFGANGTKRLSWYEEIFHVGSRHAFGACMWVWACFRIWQIWRFQGCGFFRHSRWSIWLRVLSVPGQDVKWFTHPLLGAILEMQHWVRRVILPCVMQRDDQIIALYHHSATWFWSVRWSSELRQWRTWSAFGRRELRPGHGGVMRA